MPTSLWMVLTAGLVVVATGVSSPADAASVTACSRYGRGCVTAPVRAGRFGLEVRLPGGTWIPCAQDCRITLTDETVDFWEKHIQDRGGNDAFPTGQ